MLRVGGLGLELEGRAVGIDVIAGSAGEVLARCCRLFGLFLSGVSAFGAREQHHVEVVFVFFGVGRRSSQCSELLQVLVLAGSGFLALLASLNCLGICDFFGNRLLFLNNCLLDDNLRHLLHGLRLRL